MARADSAHFCHGFVSAVLRAKVWYSVTVRYPVKVRTNIKIRATIATIPGDAWTAIQYPGDLGSR